MRPRPSKNLRKASSRRLFALAFLVFAGFLAIFAGLEAYRQGEIYNDRFSRLQKTLTPPLLEAARQRQRPLIRALFEGVVDSQELIGIRFTDQHEGWQESYFKPELMLEDTAPGYRFVVLDQRANGALHTLSVEMFAPSRFSRVISAPHTAFFLLLASLTFFIFVLLIRAEIEKLFVRPLSRLRERFVQRQFETLIGSETKVKPLSQVEGEFDELENAYLDLLARLQLAHSDALRARDREEVAAFKYRTTAELFRRQEGRSEDRSQLGEIAGGIAHEINNPLAILLGRAAQLRKILNPEIISTPLLENIIGSMENTIYRIQELVLDLETMANNPSQEELKPLSLKQLFLHLEEAVAARYPDQEITFSIQRAPDYTVTAREMELTQALIYLIENAVEAALYGPKPWVKIEFGAISDESITLLLIDSGPGIPSDIRGKIFQPFFTTKDVGQGRGTGLTLAKSIIESGRGRLAFDFQANCTTISILLPRHLEAANSAS